MILFVFHYFSASYTRRYLPDFGIEEERSMDTWCSNFIETEQEVWLKKDDTRNVVLEICPQDNNKVAIIIFHFHDKCLYSMLELYLP
jgi:uncharacterized protein YdeI (YjbR/CyaY-like superfamily)